jgi:hypothetical protein
VRPGRPAPALPANRALPGASRGLRAAAGGASRRGAAAWACLGPRGGWGRGASRVFDSWDRSKRKAVASEGGAQGVLGVSLLADQRGRWVVSRGPWPSGGFRAVQTSFHRRPRTTPLSTTQERDRPARCRSQWGPLPFSTGAGRTLQLAAGGAGRSSARGARRAPPTRRLVRAAATAAAAGGAAPAAPTMAWAMGHAGGAAGRYCRGACGTVRMPLAAAPRPAALAPRPPWPLLWRPLAAAAAGASRRRCRGAAAAAAAGVGAAGARQAAPGPPAPEQAQRNVSEYLASLSAEQLEAVNCPAQHVRVIAGAARLGAIGRAWAGPSRRLQGATARRAAYSRPVHLAQPAQPRGPPAAPSPPPRHRPGQRQDARRDSARRAAAGGRRAAAGRPYDCVHQQGVPRRGGRVCRAPVGTRDPSALRKAAAARFRPSPLTPHPRRRRRYRPPCRPPTSWRSDWRGSWAPKFAPACASQRSTRSAPRC